MTSAKFIAHRREGGDHITRRAIGQAGVNTDRGVELGYASPITAAIAPPAERPAT